MKAPEVQVQVAVVDSDEQSTHDDAHTDPDSHWISKSMSPLRELTFVTVLLGAQVFAQAGMGQTVCILQVIASAFNVTHPGELSWLIAGYSLTVGSFILLSGRLGDHFGHKPLFIAGMLWYTVCSVVSGLSVYSSQYLFILSRVLCGIGPSVCIPNALAILGRAYPPGMKKNVIFGLYGGLSPIGFVFGAVISSLFAEHVWWPWGYWTVGMLAAAASLGAYLAVPDSPSVFSTLKTRPTLKETLWATDIPAGALGITALVLFNLAWNQAVVVTWAVPYIPVFLVLGILFAVAFFYVEVKISPAPLIPFQALNAQVAYTLACVATAWGGYGGYTYYYWATLLIVEEKPSLLASAYTTPPILVGFGGALLTGYLMAKLHPAIIMVMSVAFVLVSLVLFATYPLGQSYWVQIFPSIIFAPLGLDMSFPAAILILSNAVGRENQGMAMSLVNTIVNYSVSISLGVAGTIEQQITKDMPEGREKTLAGYHGAEYWACGVVAFGLLLSLVFLWRSARRGGLRPAKELSDVEVV